MPAHSPSASAFKKPSSFTNLKPQSQRPTQTQHHRQHQRRPDLPELDARLQSISDKFIPPSPYILTVPTDRPFNLSSNQIEDLHKGTPFDPSEVSLQYLSFFSAWDNGLIYPVAGWSDEKGSIMEPARPAKNVYNPTAAAVTTAAASTNKVGTAKKISLSAYKERAAHKSISPNVMKINGTPTRRDVPAPAVARASSSSRRKESHVEKNEPLKPAKPLHRKLNEADPGVPASLHGKASTEPTDEWSPTAKNESRKLGLPPSVSPTLPPAIEAELIRLATKNTTPLDEPKARTEKLSNAARTTNGITSEPSKDDRDHNEPRVSNRFDDADERQAHRSASARAPQTEGMKLAAKDSLRTSHSVTDVPQSERDSVKVNYQDQRLDHNASAMSTSSNTHITARKTLTQEPKTSNILILKVPRSRRKDLVRLLQMPSRSMAGVVRSNKLQDMGSTAHKSVRQPESRTLHKADQRSEHRLVSTGDQVSSSTKDASKAKEKRSREEEETSSVFHPINKRQRNESVGEINSKPTTPLPPTFRSPVVSHHDSSQKVRENTPSGESKHLGARHEDAVRTPQGAMRNGMSTITGSGERGPMGARSHGASNNLQKEQNSLLREQQGHFQLGRKLKHEAADLRKSSESRDIAELGKKAVAVEIDATLCFMLAFAIGDEISRLRGKLYDPEHTWETSYPWISQVKKTAVQYGSLHGLVLQLEAVCKWTHWSEEYAQSGTTYSSENHIRAQKRWEEARRLFAEGASTLSVDDLKRSFPSSWSRRAEAPLDAAATGTSFLPLVGEFFLPITRVTSPLEAVRAGKSILDEWCETEKMAYRARVGL